MRDRIIPIAISENSFTILLSCVLVCTGPEDATRLVLVMCSGGKAWESTSGNCGMGWLLCDASNSTIDSSSSHRRFVPSALVAEALAVKAALSAAVSSHVSCINVFSDSKNLISLLKSQGQDVVLKGLLHDIVMLAKSFNSISFCYLPRLANVCADSLAKAGLYSLSSAATFVD
ncbi:hypothetical protein F2Q69_00000613 [Brassica cretica]|uniref:RNase H type-1 domain-containing protein n=1 Tax=Brassica cretica TaxID=69181 RepID=A0A8S9P266_BRACR|nr:hypothetical protein F2Q69_00000613 [Brassica cretica]